MEDADPQMAGAPAASEGRKPSGTAGRSAPNPLASPIASTGGANMPTSTSKGLHSFSLGRRKIGQLSAYEASDLPPKRVCTPTGAAGPSGASPTCQGASATQTLTH